MASLEDFYAPPFNGRHVDSLALEPTSFADLCQEFRGFVKELRKRFLHQDGRQTALIIAYPLFLGVLVEGFRQQEECAAIVRFHDELAHLFADNALWAATLRKLMSSPPSDINVDWPGARSFEVTVNEEESRWLSDCIQAKDCFHLTLMFDKLVKLTVQPLPPPMVSTRRFGEMEAAPLSNSTHIGIHMMRTNMENLNASGGSAPALHVHHVSIPEPEARLSTAAVDRGRTLLACGTEGSAVQLRPLLAGAVFAELPADSPLGVSRAHLSADQCLAVGGHWAPLAGRRAALERRSGVRLLRGHRGPVTDVRFLEPPAFLLSASFDGTVRLWDALLGENAMIYEAHSKSVLTCAVSSPLSMFASGGADALCHLWATDRPQPVRSLVGHECAVQDADFHPNHMSLATTAEDGLRLWDVGSGRAVTRIARPGAEEGLALGFARLAWSPAGTHVALLATSARRAGGPLLSVYDLRAMAGPVFAVRPPPPGTVACRPAWSADGAALALATRDGAVHVWAPFHDEAVPQPGGPALSRPPPDRRRFQSGLAVHCFEDGSCLMLGQEAPALDG